MDNEPRISFNSLKAYFCDGTEGFNYFPSQYLLGEMLFTFHSIFILPLLQDVSYEFGMLIAASKIVLPLLVVPILEICQVGLQVMFLLKHLSAIVFAVG